MVNGLNSTTLHSDFLIEVLRGNVPGASVVHLHGDTGSNDLGTTFKTIWGDSADLVYISSSETLDVVSTSVNDTNSSGTGARKVLIEGLDDSNNEISETVNLNGTTSVTTVNSYLRINSLHITDAGSGNQNDGDITAEDGSGNPQAYMIATHNHNLDGKYTVPSGKIAIVTSLGADVGKAQETLVQVCAGTGHGILEVVHTSRLFQATSFSSGVDVAAPAGTDLLIQGQTEAGTTPVSVSMNLLVIDA